MNKESIVQGGDTTKMPQSTDAHHQKLNIIVKRIFTMAANLSKSY